MDTSKEKLDPLLRQLHAMLAQARATARSEGASGTWEELDRMEPVLQRVIVTCGLGWGR